MRNPFKREDEFPEITARIKLSAQLDRWAKQDLRADRSENQCQVEEK